ncbi:MAG: putative regulator of rane protease YbbK [Actinomycetia bacterium]|jgi:membrane protein implicated in regulation of membrane protease activity|nr:putative regulator of rane protease YbbK [Actinomycetes bacterium]
MIFAWLVVGILLLLFEMHHLAFYALFGALGAFAAAIVAGVASDAIALQAGVFIVVSAVGVTAVRPYVSRAFHHHRGGRVARGVHGGLVGEEGLTLDEIGDAHSLGHIRLAGERWLATTDAGRIEAGRKVLVMDVRGTTLVVYPSDDGPPAIETDHNHGADGATDGSTQ